MDITTQQLDTLWKDRLYSISCTFSPDGKKLLISGGPSAFGKLGENIGKIRLPTNTIPNCIFMTWPLKSGRDHPRFQSFGGRNDLA